jgi:hypothetical protein
VPQLQLVVMFQADGLPVAPRFQDLSVAKALLVPNTAKAISNNAVLRMSVPLNRGKTGMQMEANGVVNPACNSSGFLCKTFTQFLGNFLVTSFHHR